MVEQVEPVFENRIVKPDSPHGCWGKLAAGVPRRRINVSTSMRAPRLDKAQHDTLAQAGFSGQRLRGTSVADLRKMQAVA